MEYLAAVAMDAYCRQGFDRSAAQVLWQHESVYHRIRRQRSVLVSLVIPVKAIQQELGRSHVEDEFLDAELPHRVCALVSAGFRLPSCLRVSTRIKSPLRVLSTDHCVNLCD